MFFRSWLSRRVIIPVALLVFLCFVYPEHESRHVKLFAVTPQNILRLLNVCDKIGGGYPATADKPATFSVCALDNVVYWRAGMTVDCDGMVTMPCNRSTDPDFMDDTSLHDSRDKPLNAAFLPYVVVPVPSKYWDFRREGIRLGAPVVVIFNRHMACGILGDEGTMGEASYAMAKELGIDPNPYTGGTSSKMTYITFPGINVFPPEDHVKAVRACISRLVQFIQSRK